MAEGMTGRRYGGLVAGIRHLGQRGIWRQELRDDGVEMSSPSRPRSVPRQYRRCRRSRYMLA